MYDAELKLDELVSTKAKKANAMVGLIRRRSSYLDGLFPENYSPDRRYRYSHKKQKGSLEGSLN